MSYLLDDIQTNIFNALAHEDYPAFRNNIEKLRQIAIGGQSQARGAFIDWYRRLNPAFERILGDVNGFDHDKLMHLHFKKYLFDRFTRQMQLKQ